MKRHGDLQLRTSESKSLQISAGFSKEKVDRFINKLTELMYKYKISLCKIFNADETGVTFLHANRLKDVSYTHLDVYKRQHYSEQLLKFIQFYPYMDINLIRI